MLSQFSDLAFLSIDYFTHEALLFAIDLSYILLNFRDE